MDAVCGRYVAASSPDLLAAYFEVDEAIAGDGAAPGPMVPNYNVAPTDPVPVVAVSRTGARRLGQMRWGLVPSWARTASGGARLINARVETVRTQAAFRSAFARRRCLLPADGFYEWERLAGGSKQPWFVRRRDRAPLAMAGLWEVWSTPQGGLLRTCTVLTAAANAVMAPIHDRMPVLLEPSHWAAWLDRGSADVDHLYRLLGPADDDLLERRPVTSRVNSVRNNGPDLLDPPDATGPPDQARPPD